MHDEQRRQAEHLFHEVVEMSREERAAYLDANCSESEVRREVDSLLAHFDDGTVTSLDSEPADAADEDLVGQFIGPYRVLQLIGEGGFGAVYMAEQEQPVRRRVALKIIKLGMDTKQVIARFEAERQALAMMDHPNIARVFDAGTTETGRPYFAMELVRGIPLTEYCDECRLSTRERLKLFVQVCRAVQHAHQKGIIHRDIKPSNVLVTLQDGVAVPKVIDFGIAKATNQRLTELTYFTEFRHFVGTPQYMSPEQAEMSGLDVDTRTDIYSLGVLMYELLTGTTPFDSRVLRSASYVELQRIIREQEPPRPSTRLGALGAQLADVARRRRTEPRALRRLIRGDLDWIVMKALEKDRTRRYETASGLAADVQHYLNHEPVLAGPPRPAYKLRKFVQRHRVGATAGSVVAAGMLVGLALATTGFVQASAERDAADAAAGRAQAISRFFQDMLSSADPMQLRQLSALSGDERSTRAAGGFARDVSVAEMVRLASTKVRPTFAGRPLLEATARETIGMTLHGLGLYADAEPELRKAHGIRYGLLGKEHPDTLRSAAALGALLLDAGRGGEALPLVRVACAAMRKVFGPEDPRTLSCSTILASVYSDQNEFLDSESIFFDTLHTQRRVLGSEHRDTLYTMWSWSFSCLSQWKLTEGEALAREVYEIAGRTLSPDDSLNILSKPLIGWWYLARFQYDEAEAVLRPGLEQCRRILGEQHPFTYMTMYALARSLQGREHQEESDRLRREALAGLRTTRGPHHWHTISTSADYAQYLGLKGRFHEASELYQRLLTDCRETFGADAEYTLRIMSRLATLLERAGRFEEAVTVRRERLSVAKRFQGTRSIAVLEELNELGQALVRMGRIDEAREATAELLEHTRRATEVAGPPPLALNNHAWFTLICVPADMRDPAAALPLAERAVELTRGRLSAVLDTLALAHFQNGDAGRAIEIQKESLKLLPTYLATNLNYGAMLVRYLLHKGDTAEADRFVREAVERFRVALGEDNPLLAAEFDKAGVSLASAGHHSMAEVLLREGVSLNRELLGDGHEQVALGLHHLAELYHKMGRYEQAEKAHNEALEIRRLLFGDDHLSVAETLHALGQCLHDAGDPGAAAPILQAALEIHRRLGVEDIPEALRVQRDLVAALIHLGRLSEALPLARQACMQTRAMFGDMHCDSASAMQTLGLLLVEHGRPEEAEPLLRRCVEILVVLERVGEQKWHCGQAESTLGYCLLSLQRYEEAEPHLLRGHELLRKSQSEDFIETRQVLERLVALYEAWGRPEQADQWRARQVSAAESLEAMQSR